MCIMRVYSRMYLNFIYIFEEQHLKKTAQLYSLSSLHYRPTLTQTTSTFPYTTKPTRTHKNSIFYHALLAMHRTRVVVGYTNIYAGTDGTRRIYRTWLSINSFL